MCCLQPAGECSSYTLIHKITMQCEGLLRALAQRNCLVPIYSCRQRDALVPMRLVPPPPMKLSSAAASAPATTRPSAAVLLPPSVSKAALFAAPPECGKRSGLHLAKSVLGTICSRALSTSSYWREAEPPPPLSSSTAKPPPISPAAASSSSPTSSNTRPPTALSANTERAQIVSVHFHYGLPQFTVPLPARNSMMQMIDAKC